LDRLVRVDTGKNCRLAAAQPPPRLVADADADADASWTRAARIALTAPLLHHDKDKPPKNLTSHLSRLPQTADFSPPYTNSRRGLGFAYLCESHHRALESAS
jgi:hypothetical protein